MPKEKTIYQIYDLHLINGEVVSLAEEYDLPFDKGFIKEFENADDNHLFAIEDAVFGSVYVQKKSIVYIKAKSFDDWLDNVGADTGSCQVCDA